MPDRIIVLPGGRVFFCEAKFNGNTLSPGQDAFCRGLRDLGCIVVEIESDADIDWFIEVYAKGA